MGQHGLHRTSHVCGRARARKGGAGMEERGQPGQQVTGGVFHPGPAPLWRVDLGGGWVWQGHSIAEEAWFVHVHAYVLHLQPDNVTLPYAV